MNLTLVVWRQAGPGEQGQMVRYQEQARDLSEQMSFLEMLDVVNERLIEQGQSPIAFDHDCREGICGTCGAMVDGVAHGPLRGTTLCQLHLRHFKDGDTIYVEPWRARAFPVIKDLVVDRHSMDSIIQAGGYVSVNTGSAPDANSVPVARDRAERAFDAATCIGCGACVAACPNASAMLFTAAKISQLGLLPQGQPERHERVRQMVAAMERAGFGNCSNHGECEAACPKEIGLSFIAQLNRDMLFATMRPY